MPLFLVFPNCYVFVLFLSVRGITLYYIYCLFRGRFGIARKCIELDSGDRYVAKYIKARPSQKAEVKREVFVMNALQHPRLVGLYDAIEEPRYLILILEL